MKTYIYSLSHPITGEIRYVGKTINIEQRSKNHTNIARDKLTHKRNWINSLRIQGLKPKFEVLDEIEGDDWIFWEKYWIGQCKSWGFNLCNHTIGGDGLHKPNQTTFKKGMIPWNLGIPSSDETKIKISGSLQGKLASAKTIELMSKAQKRIKRDGRALIEGGINTRFTPGAIPWNYAVSNYKIGGLKTSRRVEQLKDGIVVKEFLGCAEAALEMKCISESIRLVCIGKNKTAKGFTWRYKQN